MLSSDALKNLSLHSKTDYEETLEDALIDLYLSVKIRSNEEVSYDLWFTVEMFAVTTEPLWFFQS